MRQGLSGPSELTIPVLRQQLHHWPPLYEHQKNMWWTESQSSAPPSTYRPWHHKRSLNDLIFITYLFIWTCGDMSSASIFLIFKPGDIKTYFAGTERDLELWCIHGSVSHSVMSSSLWPHGPYSPWNSPGQNIWVGSLFLLQQIFPTQELNQGLCIAGGFFTSWTKWKLSLLNHLYYFPHLTDAKLEWLIQSHRALINQWNWEKRPGYLTPELFLLHFSSNFQKMFKIQFV